MTVETQELRIDAEIASAAPHAENWVTNLGLLWDRRRMLARIFVVAAVLSLGIAFILPKRYESTARIIPGENSGTGAAMYAALAGRGLDGFGGLIASLLGGRSNTSLFVDMLKSGTITGDLVDRFQLQHLYGKRYRVDAVKYLVRHTSVVDDKRSGVITITVSDTDPTRARDLAQAYLDDLNRLVNRTSTSSAHQERIFIEQRLGAVQAELERAQQAMSEFSSTHATIDIREQTHAMVDAGAKIQGELIAEQGELDSLRQIYGDGNVRVRAVAARVADLKRELVKLGGSSDPLPTDDAKGSAGSVADALYPPLRQLPRLAVPYADLYRKVRVQETVYELLTQQFEIARIQEAKDIPVISVIDAPGIPEKKAFPPRLLLSALMTLFTMIATCTFILARHYWLRIDEADPRRVLAAEIASSARRWKNDYRNRKARLA